MSADDMYKKNIHDWWMCVKAVDSQKNFGHFLRHGVYYFIKPPPQGGFTQLLCTSVCLSVRLFVCRLCRVAAAAATKVVPCVSSLKNSPSEIYGRLRRGLNGGVRN